MTKQETFDIVVRALIKQGRPSTDSTGMECFYRSKLDDGTVLKCAAGHLIPDEKYLPEMEGDLVWNDLVARVLTNEGHDLGFVRELQNAHDNCTGGTKVDFTMKFRYLARLVAQDNNLLTTALDEICSIPNEVQ